MHKLGLVARHEYRTTVRRRTFLLGTLGIPALFVATIGLSILVALSRMDRRPLGYVDHAGLLRPAILSSGATAVPVRAFPDEAAAQAALGNGTIQGFYVLPVDYLRSRQATLYYGASVPDGEVRADFERFVRASLLAGQPDSVRQRAMTGVNLILSTIEGRRETIPRTVFSIGLAFVSGLLFTLATMTSANYLIQVVAAEKESRTIEVMATSITPLQLIGGKAAGLMAVAMTQLLIWTGMGLAAIVVVLQFGPGIGDMAVPWTFLLVLVLYFLASYALVAGLMTAIGGVVSEVQQGQQIAGTLNVAFLMPYIFAPLIVAYPNSPLAVGLTLFPTTALITVSMRWAVTVVPAWQLFLSWFLLVVSAALSVWGAARVFRVGMLRYGQSGDWRGVLAALRWSRGS